MTTLREEIDRWQSDLADIADTSQIDNWLLEERRLAEAQHTILAFRARILPMLSAEQQHDTIIADEIEHLVDELEDLRNDTFQAAHPRESHRQIAEAVAALRAVTRVALRFERTLEDA